MTKTLEEIQEENRKVIIMACHPDCESYDDALRKELRKGCVVVNFYKDLRDRYELLDEFGYNFRGRVQYLNLEDERSSVGPKYIPSTEREFPEMKILGRPLSLNRVLVGLNSEEKKYGYLEEKLIMGYVDCYHYPHYKDLCPWDLTESTLEKQSEETQRAINKLLTENVND